MQENKASKEILTVPNILTLVRIALIPFIMFFYMKEWFVAVLVTVVLSFLTDVADGYIARHYNLITELGKMLDPVADKLSQIAVLLCLLTRFPHIAWALVLLIVKEVMGAALGVLAARKGVVKGAVWHGKAATFLLYSMFVLHLIWPSLPAKVSDVSILVCTGMLALSMVLYGIRYVGIFLGKVEGDKDEEKRADL